MISRYNSAVNGPFDWGGFSEKGTTSILESNARLNIWEGAVRSGKTICSLVRWLEFIRTSKAGPLLMIGRTERTLKRNVIDVMRSIVGKYMEYSLGSSEIHIAGRVIYIVGANDDRSQEKIRGLTLVGAYGDELTIWPESMFTVLLSRLSVDGAKFFGTTNPDSPYHWLKVNYIDRANELDMKVFHFMLEDNPNLSEAYIRSLKKEYTGLWYKRFIQGLWVQAEGAVYDIWDEDKFVVDTVPKCDRYCIGIDYGTSNPTVFVLLGEKDGVIYVVDEYYWDPSATGKQKTNVEHCDDLITFINNSKVRIDRVVVDPSAASFKVECERRGLNLQDADNAVVDGIRRVASLLGQDQLYVHRSCENVRKEFASYVWDAKAQAKGEDKPVKQNDHSMDALRYGIMFMTKHRKQAGPILRNKVLIRTR